MDSPTASRSARPAVLATILCSWVGAQPHITQRNYARQATRIEIGGDVKPSGLVAIDYGSTPWRPQFAAILAADVESKLPRVYRLGRDDWARLTTSLTLTVGETRVPAGMYCLALERIPDGEFALRLLDAKQALKSGWRPGRSSPINRWPRPEDVLRVPLGELGKLGEGQPVDNLEIELSSPYGAAQAAPPSDRIDPAAEDLGAIRLTIRWHTHQLEQTLNTGAKLAIPSTVSAFRRVDRTKGKQTPSGIWYQILRDGKGEAPTEESTIKLRYVAWLTDGTLFDRTRAQALEMPMIHAIAGWKEGAQLMRPGSRALFEIPPALAYGKNGIPGRVPPNSTLVFEMELVDVRAP